MSSTATVIDSGADLVAMAPADLFSGIDTASADTAGDVEPIDTDDGAPADAGIDTGADEPAPEEEPAEPEAAAPATDTPETQQTQPEELPEGVTRGKDRSGKPGYFLKEDRYKTVYGNHQLVQQVSEMLGEPATKEALQLRQEAYMAQERLYSALGSADAKSQADVLNYFFDEFQRAQQDGEIAGDPAVPLAQSFYQTLRNRSQDGYGTLRLQAARDLVGEMFGEAASAQDNNLYASAQHFARTIANVPKNITDPAQVRAYTQRMGIPFFTFEEMPRLAGTQNGGRVSDLEAENARLQSIVNGRSQTTQTAQFDSWAAGVSQQVKSAVLDQAIKPALASVEEGWKQFPQDYQDLVVDRLNRKVNETLLADPGFNERIRMLDAQARRAVSAQRRDELGKAIQQAYMNRAKLAVDAVKQPILAFAANRLKERVDQNHARRQAAQTRTAPKGSAGTVPRSIAPNNLDLGKMPDGVYDPKFAMQQARQVIFGGR